MLCGLKTGCFTSNLAAGSGLRAESRLLRVPNRRETLLRNDAQPSPRKVGPVSWIAPRKVAE
jgi:hypothetical protein